MGEFLFFFLKQNPPGTKNSPNGRVEAWALRLYMAALGWFKQASGWEALNPCPGVPGTLTCALSPWDTT